MSYKTALRVGRNMIPFREDDCLTDTAEEFGPEHLHADQSVSLSCSTIIRRIKDLSDVIRNQLSEIVKTFITFSLTITKNNDITDTAQLAIYSTSKT